MKKRKRMGIIYFSVAIVLTFLAIITGNYFTKKLSLEVGQIAPKDVYAPFQVENELATERKERLVYQNTPVVNTTDSRVKEKAIENVQTLFAYTIAIKNSDITLDGTLSSITVLQGKSPIPLYDTEYRTLLSASNATLYELEEVCKQILSNLFDEGVQEDDTKSTEIRRELESTSISVTYQKLVYEIVLSQIKGNIIIDEIASIEAKEAAVAEVEPVYILQGEKIVGQGSRITEEIHILLQQIGYLDTDGGDIYRQYGGVILFIALLLLFLVRYASYTQLLKGLHERDLTLLFILYLLMLATIRSLLWGEFVFVPIAIAAMLIAILINRNLAMVSQILLVFIAAVVQKGDMVAVIYWLLTGMTSIAIISNMKQRKQSLKCALLVGTFQSLTYFSLKLLVGAPINTNTLLMTGVAFLIGVFSVILVVGSLPLWEAGFGFITPIQLLELTNPDQPVLKRLLLEATGTYYHSLLVANLAEAAANAIGADALMARVGGYYHDIGKLTASNYFKENQTLENPHDYLEPRNSANILLSHVTGGIELADKYNLPGCIKDMILQHHGTTTMQYFYIKAKNIEGDEVAETDFQYPGPMPLTKEAGLIMLADVVEATVRSVQHKIGVDFTLEEIVRKMVRQKLDEGQLDQCPLYLSDVERIITSFTSMLQGMYHQRIEYPPRKES